MNKYRKPWKWDGKYPITIKDSDGFYVVNPGGIYPSRESDARLIEMAPTTFDILKDVLTLLRPCEDPTCEGGPNDCEVCRKFHQINKIIQSVEV